MIVNYRFEQYSYDKKKYEYHRECCFKLLFGRGWQLGLRRAKRRMIPRKSENVSKKRRWVEKVRICLQNRAWRQI